MKPSELFAVAVRVTGLVSLLYLLSNTVWLIGAGLPVMLIVRLVVWLLLSIWLLRGAPQLVRFAYRDGV